LIIGLNPLNKSFKPFDHASLDKLGTGRAGSAQDRLRGCYEVSCQRFWFTFLNFTSVHLSRCRSAVGDSVCYACFLALHKPAQVNHSLLSREC